MNSTEYKEAKKLYEKSKNFFITPASNPISGSKFRKPKSSWHLVSWVMLHSRFKKSTKLVAAQIAAHYNKNEHVSFPSYERLMILTGLSRGTVAKAVKEIKNSDEWKVTSSKIDDDGVKVRLHNKYVPLSPKNPGKFIEDKNADENSSEEEDNS